MKISIGDIVTIRSWRGTYMIVGIYKSYVWVRGISNHELGTKDTLQFATAFSVNCEIVP